MRRTSLFRWSIWHVLIAVALLALVAMRYGGPIWQLSAERLLFGGVLCVGYLLGAVAVHLEGRGSGRASLLGLVRAALAGYALPFLLVIALDATVSRFALALGLAVAFVALAVPMLFHRVRTEALLALGLGVAALVAFGGRSSFTLAQPRVRSVSVEHIITSLHAVQATHYHNYLPRTESLYTGGGMTAFGDDFLLVAADGPLYRLSWDADGAPVVDGLRTRVPLDRSGLRAASGNGEWTQWWRVLDVAIQGAGDDAQLLVSHHVWRDAEGCFVVRVSRLVGSVEDLMTDAALGEWETLFETEPCLEVDLSLPSLPFGGMEAGGRIAFVDDSTFFLSVGDHGFQGMLYEPDLVQDPDAHYGKTLLVDAATGSARVYSLGHRNAQGLWVDDMSSVWLTEHGPAGGDELNRVQEGGNYGWPLVTYGTEYGQTEWPLNARQGHHDGFLKPATAWVPSVGISQLMRVRGEAFSAWAGDLLVASMFGETLYRLRTDGSRVVFSEPVPIGDRVRDLAEGTDGRIVLLTDSYSLIVLEEADLPYAVCTGCHVVGPEVRPALGPSLSGILSAPIAGQDGFSYSEALRSVGGAWTLETLDAFLADPQGFAPGTSMQVPGVGDPLRRQQIIDYLRGL